MKVKIKCPYCGTLNTVEHGDLYGDTHVVRCDFMDGGCDRLFVVDIAVSVKASARKIDGEEEKAAEG